MSSGLVSRSINLLKRIPIDLGQNNLRTTTKGKVIAESFIPQGQGKHALDIGCREGHQSRMLEGMGYDVTSIDIEKVYDKCIVVDANAPLPFDADSFDLIWCSEVIEHLNDPPAFLAEARRVLRPGGKLLLTTPNSHFWFYPLMRLFGLSAARLQNPTHVQFFHVRDMRRLFPHADVYGFFPYMLIRRRIRRAIGLLSPTFVIHETQP